MPMLESNSVEQMRDHFPIAVVTIVLSGGGGVERTFVWYVCSWRQREVASHIQVPMVFTPGLFSIVRYCVGGFYRKRGCVYRLSRLDFKCADNRR